MKKLFIIIIILLLFSVMVSAKLSEETLKEVERLRFKHYGQGTIFFDSAIERNRDFLSIWVEDGKLFVETQDGKYFIEMKKTKGEDD